MLLSDLATAVRKSGLPVVEVPGWRTRGHGEMGGVRTIVCHHTAGPSTGNFPSLGVVRDGRAGLSGPLANLGLGRDGTVYVIAAGLCYHAGVVLQSDYRNGYSIGIEAEATGVTDWPAVQMDAYARLCAALCLHYTLPVGRVLGHKEVCAPVGRKTDPNFDMAAFRGAVANVQEDAVTPQDKKDIIDGVVEALVPALLAAKIDKAGDSVKKALRVSAGLPKDEE
jgi:hypothetical protein